MKQRLYWKWFPVLSRDRIINAKSPQIITFSPRNLRPYLCFVSFLVKHYPIASKPRSVLILYPCSVSMWVRFGRQATGAPELARGAGRDREYFLWGLDTTGISTCCYLRGCRGRMRNRIPPFGHLVYIAHPLCPIRRICGQTLIREP